MKTLTFTLLMSLGLFAANVCAMDDMSNMKDMKMPSSKMAAPAKTITGKGTVVSVDKAAGSITLKHEAIATIGWPAMTMSFKVKDKMLLDKPKTGDKVEFTLEQAGSDYIVNSLK